MIQEYMDESLILLKDLLCWSFADIVGFKLNTRRSANRTTNLTAEIRRKILAWNSADAMLYDRFLSIFKQKMREYGEEKLREDVKKLRNLRNRTFRECGMTKVSKNDPNVDPRFKPWHDDVDGFMPSKAQMNNSTCVYLAMAENPFTAHLRKLHSAQVMNVRIPFGAHTNKFLFPVQPIYVPKWNK